MIKSKSMIKIRVFGPKSLMKTVVEELYDMDVVHIEDYTKKTEEDIFDIGEPFEGNESYAELFVRTRSLLDNLGIKRKKVKTSPAAMSVLTKKIEQVYEKTSSYFKRKEFNCLSRNISNIIKIFRCNFISRLNKNFSIS